MTSSGFIDQKKIIKFHLKKPHSGIAHTSEWGYKLQAVRLKFSYYSVPPANRLFYYFNIKKCRFSS